MYRSGGHAHICMPSVQVASSRIPVKQNTIHHIKLHADDALYFDNCDADTHWTTKKHNIADQPYEHRTKGVPLALWSCLMSSIYDETIDRTVQRAPFALYTGRPQQGKRHKVYDEQWTNDAIKVNANWPICVPTVKTMKNLEARVDGDAAVLSQSY